MHNWLAAVLTVSILLCGCSDQRGGDCPPLIDYDEAFRARLAGELHRLGEDSAAARMLEDYALLRAQLRACG